MKENMIHNNKTRELELDGGESSERNDPEKQLLSCAELTEDLAEGILNRMNWPEALSVGEVSKMWKQAGQRYNPKTPRSPCLLHIGAVEPGTHRIISVTEKKCSLIRRPELIGECCGAYKSWLVMRYPSTNEMCMVNVLTRARVALPRWREDGFVSVFLSSSPTVPDCMALARRVVDDRMSLLSCRPGDEEWTKEDRRVISHPFEIVSSSEGKFYIEDVTRLLAVHSVNPIKFSMVMEDTEPYMRGVGLVTTYLVECGIDMLVVFARYKLQQHVLQNCHDFMVFRLDVSKRSLVNVNNLGNYALFLGDFPSVATIADIAGCRSNCIYFIEPNDSIAWRVFDLEDRSISIGPNLGAKAGARSVIWITPGTI